MLWLIVDAGIGKPASARVPRVNSVVRTGAGRRLLVGGAAKVFGEAEESRPPLHTAATPIAVLNLFL